MKNMKLAFCTLLAGTLLAGKANAQLSSNPDKFLGNITTRGQVDYGSEQYYKLWNQITCENESKWASVEGNNNSFNWGCDRAVTYAKQHNFPFKFHALIWGSQYPKWLESQTPEQRYKEIVQWMDEVKKKYPNLELIDVVNEAITGHQAGTPYFIEALGGTGATGYDWLIKAFEMAYERWPNAILIYNDFNTFQWNTDQYIDLVKTLRDAGAPIDAYGCQSHDLTDCSFTKFKDSMTKLQNAFKMPMYSTEYDIGTSDDAQQLQRYKEQIPYMWESDYVAGVTLWGYIYGATWTTDGNSGIIKDGKDRPAMTWLREYMQSDAAKNAKSPFPGMKKEASVYIKPQSLNLEKDTENTITVRARMRTKTIEKVQLYAANALVGEMTEGTDGQYVFNYVPTTTGTKELKAVVTCTDGFTWTRYGQINVCNARAPYKNNVVNLPGVVQFENFDTGADGIAFHDANSNKQGTGASYRTDIGGIDVEKGGSGYCVGYTEKGEWMEYTINVTEAGNYTYDIYYSSPVSNVTFSMALSTPEGQTLLTDQQQPLAKTGAWETFKTVHGRTIIPLEAGQQIIRFNIVGGDEQYVANLDKITFKRVDVNDGINITLASNPAVTAAGTKTILTATVDSEADIKNVKFYNSGVVAKTLTAAPYEFAYTPSAKGTYYFTAVATDADGKESPVASYVLTATAKRTNYKAIKVPGTFEAEDFDKGEEGLTYHDSDEEVHDKPTTVYRTDCEGVDIVSGNGGYVIGWTATNEWLEYTIDVANVGYYTCEMIASNGTTTSATINVSLVGQDGKLTSLWNVSRSGTGSWSTYKSCKSSTKKRLEAGKQILRVTFKNGNVNLDNITLNMVEDLTPVENVMADEEIVSPAKTGTFNLSGQKVNENYRGIIIQNGKKMLKR